MAKRVSVAFDSYNALISFGEYFDAQRKRQIEAMQNKNTQLWKEWRERYDKSNRHRRKKLQENS